MTAGLEAVLDNKLSPSLDPENLLQQDFRAFREHAAAEGLTPVIQDHKQVYQLPAFFIAKRGRPLLVGVRVPLKPTENHAMFSLFLHKSLPTISGDRVVRIHREKTILAVGPESSQFTELSKAELQGCPKIGETYLCGFQHTMDIGSIHVWPSGNLLPGRDGHPAQMQGRYRNGGVHPGTFKRDELRLSGTEKDDSANPMREPEVGAPTPRHADWNPMALVLHHSGSLGDGFKPPAARGHDLPDQGNP